MVTQECDLPQNRSISQYYGYMIDEYGYTINSIDTSTERLHIAVNYNTYANSTCTLEHDAPHGQVSTLSCSFSWGQPDYCTNKTNLIMLTKEPEFTGSCYGHKDDPHGQKTQISLSISASFSFSNLEMEGGWQCCQHNVNTLYFSMKQDIVDSSKGDYTDQNIGGNEGETKEQEITNNGITNCENIRREFGFMPAKIPK